MITKQQQQSLKRLYFRIDPERRDSYLKFRRTAFVAFGDCLMVPWCGMIIGIETDGYAHS